jgi:cell division inhibitor SulA
LSSKVAAYLLGVVAHNAVMESACLKQQMPGVLLLLLLPLLVRLARWQVFFHP